VNQRLGEYRQRLEAAGFSRREQAAAFAGLGRKAVPMLARGALLRPMLREAAGTPLLGRGARVRSPGQLTVGRDVVIEDYAEVQATSRDGIVLGNNVVIGPMAMIRPSGYYARDLGVGLTVGDRSGIGAGSYIGCSGGVTIGNDVLFGPGVMLFAEEHVIGDVSHTIREQGVRWASIVIEDDCWLASRVTVTSGVRIGRGSVVGAGAVVTKDVPPFSVVAGNPAKVIRSRRSDTS